MADRIEVPLELEGFAVTGSGVIEGVLEVRVRSTIRPACHHCGSLSVTGHGRNERRLRDRTCCYPCVLRWSQRRFRCNDCDKTFRERHPAVAGRRGVTNRFRWRLFERACVEPFADVAASESVSHYRVVEAFDYYAPQAIGNQRHPAPRVVALDESSLKKRHRYCTALPDPERACVFDFTAGRSKGSVFEGLLRLDDPARAGIETVVMDCHWPYRKAVEELLPQARVVVDKFHILRAVDHAAHGVRRRYSRTRSVVGRDGGLARQHNPRFVPLLWRNRWLFGSRNHRITEEDRTTLETMSEIAPELASAWWMKEAFAAIYEARDRGEAERRLDTWVSNLEAAGLPEFQQLWTKTLQWWRQPILNYFDDPVTNAFAEGVTNKIKVMKRRSYGFRDPVRYRQKVLLSCGRRPSRRA